MPTNVITPIGQAVLIPEKRIPDPKLKETLDMELLQKKMEEARKKEEAAIKILDILEVPHSAGPIPTVNCVELVAILMDEKKFRALSSKIKNKAFW